MLFLMVANGIQGTLLGIRGNIERASRPSSLSRECRPIFLGFPVWLAAPPLI